jgi:hypothetical protein
MIRWRGRDYSRREQIANACDSFTPLAPVSEIPAAQTRANWDALRPGQEIPLIGERRYGDREEEC